jgi:hypothetical protein
MSNKINNLRFFLIICILILAGCASPTILDAPPTPLPLFIDITPSLFPIFQERLNNCALENEGIAMILRVVPRQILDLEEADIVIQIGEPDLGFYGSAIQIGWEEIILVASPDVEIDNLGVDQIKELFTSLKPQMQIWTYSESHEINHIFVEWFLLGERESPYGQVVPNPGEMISSIQTSTNSIGYLPKSWVVNDIQTISIYPLVDENLRQPILALVNQNPKGQVRIFLNCLQNS